MPVVLINWLAVAVSAVAMVIVGAIWYAPLFFGRLWMKYVGVTAEMMKEKKKDAWKGYVGMLISALVTSYVLAYLVGALGAKTAMAGALVGIWSWLGFVATTTSSAVLFESRKLGWYLLTNGYTVIAFGIVGTILAVWK
ncbi:MAG: hypothetical protein HW383_53 [Candidatus Magasanikbacteria bacterium]|nr:hypothetical protein [Candidatus Magasanikbacteria bacterium]